MARARFEATPTGSICEDKTGEPVTMRQARVGLRISPVPPQVSAATSEAMDALLRLNINAVQRQITAAMIGAPITIEQAKDEARAWLSDRERAALARLVGPSESMDQ